MYNNTQTLGQFRKLFLTSPRVAPFLAKRSPSYSASTSQPLWRFAFVAIDQTISVHLARAGFKNSAVSKQTLWQNTPAIDHQDHSAVDMALITLLAFYRSNNSQLKRLFLSSSLGQRDKAKFRNDYVDRTILKIRRQESATQNVEH